MTLLTLFLWRYGFFSNLRSEDDTFNSYRKLSFMLVLQSIYYAGAVTALVVKNLFFRKIGIVNDFLIVAVIVVITTPLSLIYSFQPYFLLLVVTTSITLLLVGKSFFKSYSYAGINFYLASCLAMVVGLLWGFNFFIEMPASGLTKLLILGGSPLLLITLPSGLLHLFELYDIVCRDHWKRPRHPFPENWHHYSPFVSIHVPTYSEPPDLVIATLDKLASVDYENFEVIVIDNNTKDQSLWLPVKQHCDSLGHKFRFMHVDNLQGAKAGALNYIHKYIDTRSEIVAVIDADYQVDKLFLKSLVGYFQNPKVGFVQTPHDYREWQNNLFLTMCYWEYKLFFHSTMISLNERDAGITVGTMCLVRKEALEKAGGWSEWCVTEDSELAIRIHDVGYTSVYVGKTYGKGLIPDSFEGYKKQRYRWTAGPVQEFRHYYRHFIGITKAESRFSFTQRIYHLNHGLTNTLMALNIPMIVLGVAVIASMVIHKEIIEVPLELWITATITLFSAPLLTFMLYRVTIRAKFSDILAQAVATQALSHVIGLASIRTAITGNAQWERTNKFKSIQSYRQALISTKEEITIGLSLFIFAVASYSIFPYRGLAMMFMIGIVYFSLSYLAAPFMAIIGVWSFKHE